MLLDKQSTEQEHPSSKSTKQNPRESRNMPFGAELEKFTLRQIDTDFFPSLQWHKSRKNDGLVLFLVSRCSGVKHGFHDPVNFERNTIAASSIKCGYVTAKVKLIESRGFNGKDSGLEFETAVLSFRIEFQSRKSK